LRGHFKAGEREGKWSWKGEEKERKKGTEEMGENTPEINNFW